MKELINLYAIILIIIGITGIIMNRKNILMVIIIIELILFSCCMILIVSSSSNNDLSSSIIALYVLALAGSELAIGLTIIIRYYRLRGNSR